MSLEALYESVLEGNTVGIEPLVQTALDDGIMTDAILYMGCIDAIDEAGRPFEMGEKFVPDMLIAARTMSAVLNVLKTHLTEANLRTIDMSKAKTSTGKKLAAMLLQDAGFKIAYPGSDLDLEMIETDENASMTWLLGCRSCTR